jgi:hypothetical protein
VGLLLEQDVNTNTTKERRMDVKGHETKAPLLKE